MPVSVKAHQRQFPATPSRRTISVTRLGVSLLKVVATIERPASHHGTQRPETKNSEVFLPARLPKKKAGTKQITIQATAINQSIQCKRIFGAGKDPNSRQKCIQGICNNFYCKTSWTC